MISSGRSPWTIRRCLKERCLVAVSSVIAASSLAAAASCTLATSTTAVVGAA